MPAPRSRIDIVAMTTEVQEWVAEKGWDKDDRTFGDELMLIVSECAKALEAYRERGMVMWTENNKPGEVRTPKPEGVPSELADVFVRLLDTCSRHGLDLGQLFRLKMDYNWTRAYRHRGKQL